MLRFIVVLGPRLVGRPCLFSCHRFNRMNGFVCVVYGKILAGDGGTPPFDVALLMAVYEPELWPPIQDDTPALGRPCYDYRENVFKFIVILTTFLYLVFD